MICGLTLLPAYREACDKLRIDHATVPSSILDEHFLSYIDLLHKLYGKLTKDEVMKLDELTVWKRLFDEKNKLFVGISSVADLKPCTSLSQFRNTIQLMCSYL